MHGIVRYHNGTIRKVHHSTWGHWTTSPKTASPQNIAQNSKCRKLSGPEQHPGNPTHLPANPSKFQQYGSTNRKSFCIFRKVNAHHTDQCKNRNSHHHAAFVQKVKPPRTHRKWDLSREAPWSPITEMVMVDGKWVKTDDIALQYHLIVSSELFQPGQLPESASSMPLPITHTQVHSKNVTGIIPAVVLNDPIFPLILDCKYIYLAEPREPVLAVALQTWAKIKWTLIWL